MQLQFGTPEEAGVSPAQVERIRGQAQGWIDSDHHPALVILAARRGVVFLHEAYGTFGSEGGSPVGTDTIFPLASLAKPFTAAVAMTLVEEGLLGLNRPVHEYLPEFRRAGKEKILIHHLMTHTSGLAGEDILELIKNEHPEVDDQSADQWLAANLDQWIALASRIAPQVAPGELMMYADTNYELLAEVITRITDKSLEDAAQERLFTKLGIKDTHYILPEEKINRLIQIPDSAPFKDIEKLWRHSPSGSAGLYSTALDTAIFGQMLLDLGANGASRVLSPASIRAMTKNQIPGLSARVVDITFSHASWGLGWSVTAPYKGALYGDQMLSLSSFVHGGSSGVYFWVDPAREILGVYFSVTMTKQQRSTKGFADLFTNMVIASIEEV